MPKFFVISDVHGHYDEMKKALDEAGFNPWSSEHWLISLGDNFDRGHQNVEVMRYLSGLRRKVLVKGNHESLLQDLCERGFYYDYDMSNGTYGTVCEFGNAGIDRSFEECCIITEHRTKHFVYSMKNYFETKNYIFVHSFVPLKNCDGLPKHYIRNRSFEIDPDWRHAHASAWEEARWGNPFKLAKDGFLPDKTLVFGHYHTSWPRHKYEGKPEFGTGADFSIYYGKGYIAIDGCCAASGQLNCLVIEDDFIDGTG